MGCLWGSAWRPFGPPELLYRGGLGDSEDESDAKVGSVPGSETGQQSGPHIELLEIPRPSQDGNAAERVPLENNFATTYVSHDDQSFLQYFYNGNMQLHNYYASG